MSARRHGNKQVLTPAKIGLIGVLSAILVGVIGLQLLESDTAAKPPAASTPSTEPDASQASSSPARRAETLPDPRPEFRNWEPVALEEALLHDPFVLPDELLPAAGTNVGPVVPVQEDPGDEEIERRREETLAAFREQGVGMIWSTPAGYVATVGQRELRVGDEFDGLRVAEISPRGIVLVERETP